MSVNIPEQLRWLFRIVVGEDWPIGDEDQMRKLGAVWDEFVRELGGVELGWSRRSWRPGRS